jgi:hypothetical protein
MRLHRDMVVLTLSPLSPLLQQDPYRVSRMSLRTLSTHPYRLLRTAIHDKSNMFQ